MNNYIWTDSEKSKYIAEELRDEYILNILRISNGRNVNSERISQLKEIINLASIRGLKVGYFEVYEDDTDDEGWMWLEDWTSTDWGEKN